MPKRPCAVFVEINSTDAVAGVNNAIRTINKHDGDLFRSESKPVKDVLTDIVYYLDNHDVDVRSLDVRFQEGLSLRRRRLGSDCFQCINRAIAKGKKHAGAGRRSGG